MDTAQLTDPKRVLATRAPEQKGNTKRGRTEASGVIVGATLVDVVIEMPQVWECVLSTQGTGVPGCSWQGSQDPFVVTGWCRG